MKIEKLDFWSISNLMFTACVRSAVVATLAKARRQKRVTIGLPLVSRSNPGGATFANCILGVALAKLRKTKDTFADYTREWDESARTNRGLA